MYLFCLGTEHNIEEVEVAVRGMLQMQCISKLPTQYTAAVGAACSLLGSQKNGQAVSCHIQKQIPYGK